MKKIKFILSLILLFTFISIGTLSVSAHSDSKINYKYNINYKGSTYSFSNESDMINFSELVLNKTVSFRRACFPGDLYYPTCTPLPTTTSKTTKIGTSYENDKLIGYHTNTWEWASSYTRSKGVTLSFNVGLNYEGASASVGVSFSENTSTTYSADSKRRSRLAAFASFKKEKYHVDVFDSNGRKIRGYDYLQTTVIDKYSKVVYK